MVLQTVYTALLAHAPRREPCLCYFRKNSGNGKKSGSNWMQKKHAPFKKANARSTQQETKKGHVQHLTFCKWHMELHGVCVTVLHNIRHLVENPAVFKSLSTFMAYEIFISHQKASIPSSVPLGRVPRVLQTSNP